MQAYSKSISLFILVLIALYFPIYSLSIVSGVSANKILALLIATLSVIVYCDKVINFLVVLAVLALLVIKYYLTEGYQIRFIGVSVVGWIILYAAIKSLRQLKFSQLNLIKKILWIQFVFFSSVAALQYLKLLPITIGDLTFANAVGAGFSDGVLGAIRPNGYFYHPYDLAIFLSPFVLYAAIRSKKMLLVWCAMIAYAIYLKAFFVYFFGAVIVNKMPKSVMGNNWIVVLLCILVSALATIVTILYAGRDFTAGRTLLWSMYLSDYIKSDIAEIILGLAEESVSIYRSWEGEVTYPPHNQLLFILCFGGAAFLFLYASLFKTVLDEAGENKTTDVKIFICVSFLSLGLSGDLTLLFPFWISACIASLIFYSRSEKYTTSKEFAK